MTVLCFHLKMLLMINNRLVGSIIFLAALIVAVFCHCALSLYASKTTINISLRQALGPFVVSFLQVPLRLSRHWPAISCPVIHFLFTSWPAHKASCQRTPPSLSLSLSPLSLSLSLHPSVGIPVATDTTRTCVARASSAMSWPGRLSR